MKFELLKDKNFLNLMMGQLVSNLGTRLQAFALSLYVFNITQSATAFASVLAVSILPSLFLGPFAGVFVDRFERKKIIVGLDILSGLMTLLLFGIMIIAKELPLWAIYIHTIGMSTIGTLFNPAINTVIPSIMDKEKLLDANSMNSFLISSVNLIAPMLGAVLLEVMGLPIILVSNGLSFLVSALFENYIKMPSNKIGEVYNISMFKEDLVEGLKFVKKQDMLKLIIVIGFMLNFAYNPFMQIGVLFLVKSKLNLSDVYYGYIQSGLVISVMIAPLLISKKENVALEALMGKFMVANVLLMIVVVVAISLNLPTLATYALSFVAIALIVVFTTLTNILLTTFLQKTVPLEMLGRVGTIFMSIVTAAVPIGQIVFSQLYDKFEFGTIVLLQAILIAIPVSILLVKSANKEKSIESQMYVS